MANQARGTAKKRGVASPIDAFQEEIMLLSDKHQFGITLVLLLVLLLTYGCAPKPIKLENGDLVRIKEEKEILAVHYPGTSPSTTYNSDLGNGMAGAAGGYILFLPVILLQEYQWSKQVEALSLEDPASRVKARFISALKTAAVLKNVRTIQEPVVGDSLDELKTSIGEGLIIDVRTHHWFIAGNGPLGYWARSRVVRLEDSKILWQGVCQISDGLKGSYEDVTSAQGAHLKVKLNEVADACSDQLVAQFLEK